MEISTELAKYLAAINGVSSEVQDCIDEGNSIEEALKEWDLLPTEGELKNFDSPISVKVCNDLISMAIQIVDSCNKRKFGQASSGIKLLRQADIQMQIPGPVWEHFLYVTRNYLYNSMKKSCKNG